MDIQVTFQPTSVELSKIENWLKQEDQDKNEGFYCNWNSISDSFRNEELIIVKKNYEPIGFISFRIYKFRAIIKFAEIRPNMRNKGIGKVLIGACIDHFIKSEVLVIELECSPTSSFSHWKSFGFVDFPENEMDRRLRLFKILVPTVDSSFDDNDDIIVELWDCDFNLARSKNLKPTWQWRIKYKTDSTELVRPIIQPLPNTCKGDWRIRWREGNDIIEDSLVKRFSKEEIEYGDFIIIRNLIR